MDQMVEEKSAPELRKQVTVLENQVLDLQNQLAELRKDLDSFTYSVSHDLRAPLRAIDGFSRILAEDFTAQLDEEGKKYLGFVQNNAQQLSRLIDDLLVYHRAGKVAMNATELDLSDLARQVASEQKTLQDLPSGPVDVAINLKAVGDPTLIRQMMSQLMSNALKAGRSKASPSIKVGQTAREGEAVFFVQDNGIGFDMQYAPKLFQVFQKLHPPDEFEGNGTGLAVAQRILRRHGGRIWAEATPGHGATFYFTLPRPAK